MLRQMRKIAANRRRLSTMINAENVVEETHRTVADSNSQCWSVDKTVRFYLHL